MTQAIDYAQLAGALIAQQMGGIRTKGLPSGTPSALFAHGPTGLFSVAGMQQNVFSAMMLPGGGLANELPVYTSNLIDPIRQLITGVGAATGSNPTNVCDDPKTAGFLYACATAFVFGRLSMQSPVFDVDNFGRERRGERFDLRLIGSNPSAQSPLNPTIRDNALSRSLNSDIAANMYALAVAWQREVGRLTFTGNPANNTAGGGYKEFKGLDILINTGYTDAIAGGACAAVDSYVVDFSASITASAANTIKLFTNAYRYVKSRARLAGLEPVKFAIVLRPEAYYELTEIWPCAYATYRCGTLFTAADSRTVDGLRLNEMRDTMRAGEYLLIDGERVRVILDDNIIQTDDGAGVFESDAYIVPLTVLGNIPTLYWEARNYASPDGAVAAGNMLASGDPFYATDGGRFLWVKKPVNNFCVQTIVKTEPRLILETPHLAARLVDLQYTPTVVMPSGYPDEDGYKAGGVQTRA